MDLPLFARRPRRIFPTSLTGDVTSEIAEDDWERGCVFHSISLFCTGEIALITNLGLIDVFSANQTAEIVAWEIIRFSQRINKIYRNRNFEDLVFF